MGERIAFNPFACLFYKDEVDYLVDQSIAEDVLLGRKLVFDTPKCPVQTRRIPLPPGPEQRIKNPKVLSEWFLTTVQTTAGLTATYGSEWASGLAAADPIWRSWIIKSLEARLAKDPRNENYLDDVEQAKLLPSDRTYRLEWNALLEWCPIRQTINPREFQS